MHRTTGILKTGEAISGVIWEFKPLEGWFRLYGGERILFRECASLVTSANRVSVEQISDVDELQRARKQGWDGD